MTSDNSSRDQMLSQAQACYDNGDFDTAAGHISRILQQDPSSASTWRLAAHIAAARDLPGDALQNINEALSRDPDNALLYYDRGLIYKQLGDTDKAEASYRRALKLQPAFPEALLNLGNLYRGLKRPDDAIACYRQAMTAPPGYRRARQHLAQLYHELGAIAQAGNDMRTSTQYYQQALELDPDKVATLASLADVHEKLQRLQEAEHYVQRALSLDPAYPLANRVMATLLRCQDRTDKAYELLSPISIPDNQPLLAQDIHFELGKICDRSGRYAEAFDHFSAGKRYLALAQHASMADKDHFLSMITSLKNCFTHDWVKQWQPIAAENNIGPVFLIGFPRSGTTLLDQILDSHPAIHVVEEKPILSRVREQIEQLGDGYPVAMADLDERTANDLRTLYYSELSHYAGKSNPTGLTIDKLPLNILHVGLCARLFPSARYILALRHPCDATLSCFMQPFTHNPAMASFYTIDDSITMYAETMSLWLQYRELFDLSVHEVRYEDIVADFSGQTRRILEFLGLPWDERVKDYHRHAGTREQIMTPSYNQVRQQIYSTSLQRWKNYLPFMPSCLDRLRHYIEAFGYCDDSSAPDAEQHIKPVSD